MDTIKQTTASAVAAANKAEKKLEESLTVFWHDLEEWQKDNHYIHSGYRPASNSFARSLHSLSYLHNESVNIWTHLLGCVATVITGTVLHQTIAPRYEAARREDLIAFGCFFAGAVACLGMSATFHTISNHSESVQGLGNRLDYLGIVFLIWGSFVPTLYYGFHDDARLFKIYFGMITTNCLTTALMSSLSVFRTPTWRPFRAIMFVATGLSGVVPAVHGVWIYGVDTMDERMGLSWTALQAVLYIAGAALYAVRGPLPFPPHFSFFLSS
jgi:adiponectin receptor